MWPWPLLTSMASLPDHGAYDRGPPCTTHDTSTYANSHVMHALCLHIGLPVDGRPLTTLHVVHPLHPTTPPPPAAVLVMTIFQKAVDAFRNEAQ